MIRTVSGKGPRSALYLLVVFAGFVAGIALAQRSSGIFSCQAEGYGANRYLAYCAGDHYGDYDHGAFWFELQSQALEHARNADVLFLGNSRMQVALSSPATDAWFSAVDRRHYLLGFMYEERMGFAREMLGKLRPRAAAYVINLDTFFQDWLSVPARFSIDDPEAQSRYRTKDRWQVVHRRVCGTLPQACGRKDGWFRTIETGAFVLRDAHPDPAPVGEVVDVDAAEVQREVALAEPFLTSLAVPRRCIVFTLTPYGETPTAAARAIAAALGVQFVAPRPDGLMTLDGTHLDVASAERWSADFFREAGPSIETCFGPAGGAK